MKAGTRVKIVSIHKEDAYYDHREIYTGCTGTVVRVGVKHRDKRHYGAGIQVDGDPSTGVRTFYKVKLERI